MVGNGTSFRNINNINCKDTLISDECGTACSKFGGAPGTHCPATAISIRKFMETFGEDELNKYVKQIKVEALLEGKLS